MIWICILLKYYQVRNEQKGSISVNVNARAMAGCLIEKLERWKHPKALLASEDWLVWYREK
jgi:HEAT repeat protein